MRKLLVVGSRTYHTYNYIELIQDAFDEIVLITDTKRDGFPFAIYEIGFSLRNIADFIQSPRKIAEIVKNVQPDVIHLHQANSFAFYTLRGIRKTKIPVILTSWGSDILVLPKKNWFLKQMVKFNLRNADRYTSDSVYMASEMKRLLPSKKMDILIANFGIAITPVSRPKEPIFYSNRTHKQFYRIDAILRAFAKFLNREHTEKWRLVIAGEGSETDALKQLCIEEGINDSVSFVGWLNQEDNATWYARSRYFVSIPESDATAISLLEAMASECIPVLSDLPANREWISDKENGIIVEDTNADFLSSVFSIDVEKASLINKKLVKEYGTKEVNKEKFLGLYQMLFDK